MEKVFPIKKWSMSILLHMKLKSELIFSLVSVGCFWVALCGFQLHIICSRGRDPLKKWKFSDFPGGQWLRLHASISGGVGSVPGQGTKIPYAKWLSKKKKKGRNENSPLLGRTSESSPQLKSCVCSHMTFPRFNYVEKRNWDSLFTSKPALRIF